MNNLNSEGLKLYILPGNHPPGHLRDEYLECYKTWKAVWEEAATEIEGFSPKIYSNDFLRQDEIIAVFHGKNCASLSFWTELDMSLDVSNDDQYFQSWDLESIEKLRRTGERIGKNSYLTIPKIYRSWAKDVSISLKDLQVALFGYRFLESSCSAMVATTRNNRGMNLVCRRSGAVTVKSDVMQYGSEVDLMTWSRKEFYPETSVSAFAQSLWINRTDFKHQRRIHVSRREITHTIR